MVTSSKTICNAFRVVVCAAILTGSLFGPALHELQHALDRLPSGDGSSAQVSTPDVLPHCKEHAHAGLHQHGHGHSHAHSASHDQGSQDSAPEHHPHDSSTCAICYVISLQLDRAEAVELPLVIDSVQEFVIPVSDVAVEYRFSSPGARGPPYCA
ncbi:MAG: hypothetical protein JNM43_11935 [Planctomycetaceae bacterium]|nr:hypothetical protein [Planctomycetaceae bacterium]